MAKKEKIEFELPRLDEYFTTQEERDEAKLKKIYDIPIDEIDCKCYYGNALKFRYQNVGI